MKILQLVLNFFNAGKVDFYDLRRNDIRVFVKGEDDLEESNQELTAQDTSPANHGQDHLSPPSSNGAYSPFSPPTHRMHSVMGLTSIRNQLTWYYQLKDVAVRQEYYEFTGQKKSLWFLLFSNLLFTIVLLPFSIATLVYSADDMTNWQLLSSAFSFGFVVIGIVLGWIVYVHNKYTSILFPQITPTTRRKWINIFQHVYIAVMELYMVNIFIRQSLIPFCKHDETGFHNAFSVNGPCGSVDVRVAALVGNGLLMLSIPLLYFFNIPETRIEFTWTSFTFCFVTFALVCAYLNSVSSILLVGVWQCACMFAVADAQLRNVLLFVTNQELKETIVENERMADELHANELRHMIGNVAHDLKTPLSSFTTGVEYIQHLLDEYMKVHQIQGAVAELMESIKSCLSNIRNTNSFMLMTINRCIDYTKASRGLKLVPKNETFELLETLTLPLSCMQNIQNRIQIHLHPLARNICTHIISDRQWLQENILCLLSNAVKYSTSGSVTITVSLQLATPQRYSSKMSSDEELSILRRSNSNDRINSYRIYPILEAQQSQLTNWSVKIPQSELSVSRNPSKQINKTISKVNVNEAQHLLFEIEDTGIGIPEEAMSTLFNPFKQTQRLAGGTGLGLYSLAKRIEAMKGSYGVKARKDGQQGSLFWFTIPYRPDEATAALSNNVMRASRSSMDLSINSTRLAELMHQTLKANGVNASQDSGENEDSRQLNSVEDCMKVNNKMQNKKVSLQILIVDDSPSILKMTSMMLRKLGHVIETAENGEVAVRMIADRWTSSKNKFDIILMDLQMPIMDGLEATKRIRGFEILNSPFFVHMHLSEPLPGQIVIGMSANSDHETTEAAFAVGVNAFMGKPFNLTSFSETLENLISTGQLQSIQKLADDDVHSFKNSVKI